MSLKSTIGYDLRATLTGSSDFGAPLSTPSRARTITLANGTGADQADRTFWDRRTIAASGTENLDLAGVLVDALGTTLTFAKIKALLIEADAANVNNVVIGGHASAAWATLFGDSTDKLVIRPGFSFLLAGPSAAAYAVTATTADMLLVANSGSGTGVTYNIAIIGTSA